MRHGTNRTPQGSFGRSLGEREYQRLEQRILDATKVACTVVVSPGQISIRTSEYSDFIVAKAEIANEANGRVIVRSI